MWTLVSFTDCIVIVIKKIEKEAGTEGWVGVCEYECVKSMLFFVFENNKIIMFDHDWAGRLVHCNCSRTQSEKFLE